MTGLTRFIERPARERTRDWKEIRTAIPDNLAAREAARCNFCLEAPCVTGCPAEVDVAAFVRRIRVGDLRSAIRIIRRANPFAGVCGRICPAERFCIGECRNRYCTAPLDIAALQRYVSDAELMRGVRVPKVTIPKGARRVACVGAGPASLSCAAELATRGYRVTVFEQNELPGGMLTYGIPSYRLNQKVTDTEIDYISRLGPEIKTGKKVRNVRSLLKRGFSAVFVGTGLWKSRWLDIPGSDLEGVWDALDFIAAGKFRKKKPRVGSVVAVFGGGNTAMDCAGTALRLGAKRVIIIYRRGGAEMPAWESEVEMTFREGTEFMFLTAPVRVLGKKRVEGVECIKMRLGSPDASGRPRPIPIPGSEFTFPVTTVIQAVGQGAERDVIKSMGIAANKNGIIRVRKNGATSVPGVFAGGDAVNGGASAVEAVADGKRAAEAIDRFLSKKKKK